MEEGAVLFAACGDCSPHALVEALAYFVPTRQTVTFEMPHGCNPYEIKITIKIRIKNQVHHEIRERLHCHEEYHLACYVLYMHRRLGRGGHADGRRLQYFDGNDPR